LHGGFDDLVEGFGQSCRGGGRAAQLVRDGVVKELAEGFGKLRQEGVDLRAEGAGDLNSGFAVFHFLSPLVGVARDPRPSIEQPHYKLISEKVNGVLYVFE